MPSDFVSQRYNDYFNAPNFQALKNLLVELINIYPNDKVEYQRQYRQTNANAHIRYNNGLWNKTADASRADGLTTSKSDYMNYGL